MSGYWTNFVKRGDPNGPRLPAWPRFTTEHGQALRLDDQVEAVAFPVNRGLETMEHLYNLARRAPFDSAGARTSLTRASQGSSPSPETR